MQHRMIYCFSFFRVGMPGGMKSMRGKKKKKKEKGGEREKKKHTEEL